MDEETEEWRYWKYNPPSLAGKLMTDDVDFLNSLDPTNPSPEFMYNPFRKGG